MLIMSAEEVKALSTKLNELSNETDYNLKEMRQSVNSVHNSLSRVEETSNEIKGALLGNPKMGITGLVEQIKSNTEKSDKLEKRVQKIEQDTKTEKAIKKATLIKVGGISSFGGASLWELLKYCAAHIHL